jgi:hypothetical protein
MADAHARLERLHRCNIAQGHIEPIMRRQQVSAEMKEEEDLKSSYVPSGRSEPSLTYIATITSLTHSPSQLTPV